MGVSTAVLLSEVIGAAGGGASLSFADSTSDEGVTEVPAGGPDGQVLIPIPAGVDQSYRLRAYIQQLTDGGASIGLASFDSLVFRLDSGILAIPSPAFNQTSGGYGGSTPSAVGDDVVLQLAFDGEGGNPRHFRWRWVLSPVDEVPFAVTIVEG